MPFLTEEIWALSGNSAAMLAVTPWPDLSRPDDSAAEAEIGWVIDLVSEIRSVRSEMGVPAGARLPLTLIGATPDVAARADAWGAVIANLARLSGIDFAASMPPGSTQIIARGAVAALPLKGVVDVDAERARLRRELDNLVKENVKIDARLANADFIARAKEEVIEDNRERREVNAALIARIGLALSRLHDI
jgi:valyl-tRNA synthetase